MSLVSSLRSFFLLVVGIPLFFLFTVPASAAPAVSISVSPQNITQGETSKLSWTISGATSCTGKNTDMPAAVAWSTTDGSADIAPAHGLVYELVCLDGSGNSAKASVQLFVKPVITSFTADKATVVAGGQVTFTWTSTITEANGGCSLAGKGYPTNGSATITLLKGGEYKIFCSRGTGLADPPADPKSVQITVDDSNFPSVNISVNGVNGSDASPSPTSVVAKGTPFTVAWSTKNAVSCSIPAGGSNAAAIAAAGWTGPLPTEGSKEFSFDAAGYYDFRIQCSDAKGTKSIAKEIAAVIKLDGGGNPNPNPNPQPPACIPDGVCTAAKTCSGLVCKTNCGVKINGTKDCSPAIASFTVDKATLAVPGDVTLTWQTVSVATCTATGDWGGLVNPLPNGSLVVKVNKTSNFHLICETAAKVATEEKSVKVTVGSACTPNEACALNLCNGTTCSDGCGGDINGKKDCSEADCENADNNCAKNRCDTDTCVNSCGKVIQGDKVCVAPKADTTCKEGTCRAKNGCNAKTEREGASCDGGNGICCVDIEASAPTMIPINFVNPLGFNTVDDLLTKILGFLQAIIVILSLIMIVIGALIYMTAAGDEGKVKTGKMVITAALVGLALALAAPSFLKEIGNILGWNGVNPGVAQGAKSFLDILQNVLNFLLSVLGIIGIIMLVVGGLMYLLSAGDESRIETGKKIVTYSLIGIAVALGALVLVNQVILFLV